MDNPADWTKFGFSTRAIHAGQEPDPGTGSVAVPIYQTSTFGQESPGKTRGFEYSRSGNPTRLVLENSIASLEGARYGLAFSSGMGAISTIGNTLRSGQKVLICDDVYGGTYRIFTKVFSRFGVVPDFVDASTLQNVERSLKDNSYAFVLIESPTNPLMKVIDIKRVSKLSHDSGAKTIVDNTFPSPYLCNPLELGADLVVHSTTKYLGGHSDLVGGAVATNDDKIFEELKFLQNACGAVPGPFDCWLVLRGIKTLSIRMDRHCKNGAAIAELLDQERKAGRIARVNYPGLKDGPFHDLAGKQMRQFGGMLSFEMPTKAQAKSFIERLKIFTIAESLGGVESLVEIPSIMTHASLPEHERTAKGITDSLIRLSVGIEDTEDLVDDISQALSYSRSNA